jgi:hypothetical protein
MKTIIAGSRGFNNYAILENAMSQCLWPITEVVSGCARGADTLGERWAHAKRIPVKLFPADWDRDGNRAGYIRNAQMARYAEALIAFWDGKSRGTRDMIETAKAKGWRVMVVPV